MYIDQPAPVGFSKGKTPKDSIEAAKSTLLALEAFFIQYPSYNTRVYLVGVSYAGHYIPPLAWRAVTEKSLINLKGIILGNSWVNPVTQIRSLPKMAYESGTVPSVINKREYDTMVGSLLPLLARISRCLFYKYENLCKEAILLFKKEMLNPVTNKGISQYDLRNNFPLIRRDYEKYFNNPEVQAYLNVDGPWEATDSTVEKKFTIDYMVDYSPTISAFLNAGFRVLLYAGDQDYICNWIGNHRMALDIDWSGHDGYSKAEEVPYNLPSGEQVGVLRSYTAENGGQLNFAQVFKAGHTAAVDFPDDVLKLVEDFVENKFQ